ncbi:MAG: hypothetical protein ACYCQI_07085 [Gammaproteobacteria bacterium]
MKKISSILAICLLTAGVNANAADIKLGKGKIGNPQYYPESASLSLAPLKPGIYYNITCKVSDAGAQVNPVIIKFEVTGPTMAKIPTYLDGKLLDTKQGKLKDNNEHTVEFIRVPVPLIGTGEVDLIWLASDGLADPVEYDCSAYPYDGFVK